MAKEILYLMPGSTIGKSGLPGGKLECKKGAKPLKIEDKHAAIIIKNIPGLKVKGILKTSAELDAIAEKLEKAAEADKNKKSDKRVALETEAAELEIEFNTKTSNKDLETAIEEKKTAPDPEDGE